MSGKRYRGASVSKAKRERIIERYGGRCWICGSKPPVLTLDHVHPHSLGGKEDEDNLRPACPRCNRRKGSRTDQMFSQAYNGPGDQQESGG